MLHPLVRRRAGAAPHASEPRVDPGAARGRPDLGLAFAGLRAGDARAIAALRGLIRQQLRWIDGPEPRDWWEDLAQEVLVALLRRQPDHAAPSCLAAYLRRVVYAAYVDRLRAERGRRRRRSDGQPLCWRRHVSWEAVGDPRAATPSLLDSLLHDGIGEALSLLDAPERRAVVCKYILGLSDEEAVALIGGSRSSYRRAVTRGVEAMRRTLTQTRQPPRGEVEEGSWRERECA